MDKHIIFVVGHEHFGKSTTLRSLLNLCQARGRRIYIRETEILIRSMSNDDQPEGYFVFMRKTTREVIIAALCPKFQTLRNANEATKYIDGLLSELRKKGYKLHFFVLKHQWGTGSIVTPEELAELVRFGEVDVFKGRDVDSASRAKRLMSFVAKALR